MRKNVLPIAAGVLGSLALAVSASADFVGFKAVLKSTFDTTGNGVGGPEVGVVDTWNIYAIFDNPLDALTIFFVDPELKGAETMSTSSDLFAPFDGLGDGFWNTAGQLNNIPQPGGFTYDGLMDEFDADTYLTLGLKAGHEIFNEAIFPFGSAELLQSSGIMNGNASINEEWGYVVAQDFPQSHPIDGQVLIFNVSVQKGQHASGKFNIQWGTLTPGAGGGQGLGVEWTTIPAPGVLALLGLAGLAGTRRRRRG